MNTATYRGIIIERDGDRYTVVTENGDRVSCETVAEAMVVIDNIRLERTLNAMARDWYK